MSMVNCSSEQCVESEAEQCFYRLFDQMANICSDSELTFRCHHYKFLDDCFARDVGICAASQVGRCAKLAYKRRQIVCERQNPKLYRDAAIRRHTSSSSEGSQSKYSAASSSSIYVAPSSSSSSHYMRSSTPPNELQFISLFGYLQTQCSIGANQNCSTHAAGGNYEGMIETCQNEIRSKALARNSDFDRHQILRSVDLTDLSKWLNMNLRLKLDTSKKLLEYPETKRNDECLIVRATLSDIYRIHHRYCFQAVITRCLCEQLGFERSCGVDCSVIEPRGPNDDRLAWSDFRGRLMSSSASSPSSSPTPLHQLLPASGNASAEMLLLLSTILIITLLVL
ncbi:unnamed protein product [Anisakis simplex]|uniref:GDNF domain-containing protein n=1 Tax=Anisakis simplex TaxID=6269 RepID=A0A0M3IZC8_ANISI|nr:unnamed protein product [Anisakis simplex]